MTKFRNPAHMRIFDYPGSAERLLWFGLAKARTGSVHGLVNLDDDPSEVGLACNAVA